MLTIRLRRAGKKNFAMYRVVVAQSTAPIQGKFMQRLGHYNPHTKEIVLDKEQLLSWIDKGAQPSNTVAKLMERAQIRHKRVSVHVIPKRAPRSKKKEEKPAQASTNKSDAPESAPENDNAPSIDTVDEIPADSVQEKSDKQSPDVPEEPNTETHNPAIDSKEV